ncbi:MAG: ATP-dependent Clp protease proteolytic subunit [Clostridia bacterium]|nr:ATP-dependent Clp protease proteolytic subunit [Clostridia bacterium]
MSFIPYVYEANGVNKGDLFSRMLDDRIIFLTGVVDSDMAELVIAQLLYLESKDPKKDVFLYINSPGGSVSDGMAIHDTMQYIKCDVQTICVGEAASMGAFLLASGAKGKRYCLKNSEVMIHQVLSGYSGQATDLEIHTRHTLRIKERMNKLLSEYTGQPYEKVCLDTERDYFMNAEEALEYGIIDKVFEHRE